MPICHKIFKKILSSCLSLPGGKVLWHPFLSFPFSYLLKSNSACRSESSVLCWQWALSLYKKLRSLSTFWKTWVGKQCENGKFTPPPAHMFTHTYPYIHTYTQEFMKNPLSLGAEVNCQNETNNIFVEAISRGSELWTRTILGSYFCHRIRNQKYSYWVMKLFLKKCQKFYIQMLSLLYLKVLSSIDIVKWPEFSPMRSVKHYYTINAAYCFLF